MAENNVNDITNQLILKYDDKFNKLYNKTLEVDSSIMNKEEIITKINNEINNKNYKIAVLQYTIFFSLILSALIILFALKKFSLSKLIIFIIILLFVYLITIYYGVYQKFYLYNLGKIFKSASVSMAEYKADLFGIVFDYQCPASCPPIEPVNNPNIIQGYKSPTLKTDSQLNVWEDGDVPADLWTTNKLQGNNFYTNYEIPNYNATLQEEIANSPKPAFGTSYPNTTYYKCAWLGGKDDYNYLPNTENKKYSSIPCTYRPNYTEEARYICSKNPNNLSSDDFNKYCDNI